MPSAQRRSAPSPRSASSPISAPASRRRSSRRSSGSGAGSYQCASRAARRASSPTNWPRCDAPGPRSSSSPARARSTRSTPCSADSRCSALAWSATALRRIPAASCGSPSGTASPSSACPRVGCSLRRRRSTSCFRRSWRVSTWTTGRSPSSATAACSRATWPTASRPIGRTLRVGSSNERHAGGAGTLQRCHPGAMASAALPRRAAGSRCGRRGRQPALRRPRAADAGARGRARQRGPVCGRLVRDLRGVGRRARRARRRALARRGPEGGGRGPAGGAPSGHSPHADALRDAPALGARDRAERQAMRLDELTRPDFPILERVVNGHPLVYLDSAASSQRPRTVIEAMSQYYARSHANVHRSIHTLGEEATELYEAARERVQRFIGAASREEVVFTHGTTDGIDLLAGALGRTLRAGDEILITDMEHHSNIIPWQMAARDRGVAIRSVPLRPDGTLDLDAFERLLGPRTRIVAFAHVSNVLGTINPVARMAARARRAGAVVVVDGAQAAPHLSLNMSLLDCDYYVFSAHKMLGPTGIGVLGGRRALLEALEPARGGSEMIKEVWVDRATWNDLPWRFEPGTPPIAETVGLTAAIEYLEKIRMERVREHEQALAVQTVDLLSAIPGVRVYGPRRERGAV